jgi:hypothetical protein
MENELGLEAAELYDTANLLMRHRNWHVCNGLDIICRNWNFPSWHNLALVLHLMKTEEAFLRRNF